MEWFYIWGWFLPALTTVGYLGIVKVCRTVKDKKLSPPLRLEYSTARREGELDMARALFDDISTKILYQLRKIIYDDKRSKENRKIWRGRYDVYQSAFFSALSEEQRIEMIAEMVHNYELIMRDVYNFDLSLGQYREEYLGSDDENKYEAYIQGGLSYLDKIDNKKLQNLEVRDRVNRRKQGLKEINHRWSTVNEELTRLRNQPIEYDAKKAFDKELNS